MHHYLWCISLPQLQREIALIFVQCVVPGNIHTPHRGHFCFSPPWNGIPGGVCQTPLPHPLEFPTWFGNPWKDYIRQKCCCTILLCERWLSLLFTLIQRLIISILPCTGISQIIVHDKALRKHGGDTLHNTNDASVKEPVGL